MTLDIMENPKEEIDAQLARSESPRPALSKEEEENEGAVGGVSEGASGGAGEGVSGESGECGSVKRGEFRRLMVFSC